ncbi:MAG: hypothetical protein QOE60_652 [Thermoleophilaceae bacterium]|nr:hypothetical protein [Thermoleophilaceae bacterium]
MTRRLPVSTAPVAVVLFVVSALLSGLSIRWGINPHDEGLMLQAGERIADGQLPYRDFYANYGPGQYFLIGGLDWLFGPSLLTWRIVRVLLDAGVAVLAYALVRRDAPEPLALGAWLAVAAAMAYPSIPHPNPTALALAFGGLMLAERRPALAGALAGVAIVFRLDVGAAALAGVMLVAWSGPRSVSGAALPAGGGHRAAARAGLTGVAVALVLMAPVVLAAPGDFWDQTIGFALDQQGLQRLPLPGAWHGGFEPNKILQHYYPYVLLAGTALWLVAAIRGRLPARVWAAAPLAAAGIVYLLARADVYHLIPLAAVLPVMLATAAARERSTAWAAALVLALGLIALQGVDRKRIQLLDPPPLATIHVDVADGVKAPPEEARALEQLTRYVRDRVPPGAPVFVANPRFDLVTVGNPLVYVLVDRPNPTRYDVMQPGVVTTAPVQREIVGDLERSRPRLVIRWLSPLADLPEDNGAGRPSGVRILDRYLARTYAPQRRFGDYLVLARR